METQQRSCADKVQENFNDREKDFVQAKEFYNKYEDATEGEKIALEVFNEDAHLDGYEDFYDYINNYGLAFDYVEKGTFTDQERGYFRYQLSWGGPSDEINFYRDGRIEYRYKDWFDGAVRELDTNEDWVEWLDDTLFFDKESMFEQKELESVEEL